MAKLAPLWTKRLLVAAFVLAIAGALGYALWPRAVPVDTAVISLGPLRVTVDEEGKARIKDVFVVSAPVAGRLQRLALKTGQEVKKNDTVLAVIEPAVPPFMDLRALREMEQQIKSAEAAEELAKAEVRQIHYELQFAERELTRAVSLAKTKVIPERNVEKARMEADRFKAALARAEANEQVRRYDHERVLAMRTGPGDPLAKSDSASCCVSVQSPVSGRVLKIIQESEQVVAQGAPLVELGDPERIEVTAELLSADAVRVPPGAAATIEGWGGEVLAARVDRVDPAGFTKISALGIEEQRVRVVLSLTGTPEQRLRLGHDYRVFVRIMIDERTGALLVPLGALFRKGDAWAVYAVEEGQAHTRTIELGPRNTSHAEVISGLAEGTRVILHPSDRVGEAVSVAERSPAGG